MCMCIVCVLHTNCDALFQRPNTKFSLTNDRWFDNMALGVKTLGNMMAKLFGKYHLGAQYTNHCLRATTVTALNHAGVEATDICHVTGHRSAESLKHYCDKPSLDRSQSLSDVLHNYLDHEAGEGTSNQTLDVYSSKVGSSAVTNSGGNNQSNIIQNLNFGNGLPNGIFSGAVFHGQVNINFNINK